MSKRDKTVAKIHSELKAKETSLKAKIKNAINETDKAKLADELYDVQYRLMRGAPNFRVEERPNKKKLKTFYVERIDVSWCVVEATTEQEALDKAEDVHSVRWDVDIGDTTAKEQQ